MSSSTRASRTGNASATRSSRKAHTSTAQPSAAMASADPAVATPIPEELRHSWVAEAAYYIAERRGFNGGSPEDDWCQAEAEIAQLLAGTRH